MELDESNILFNIIIVLITARVMKTREKKKEKKLCPKPNN